MFTKLASKVDSQEMWLSIVFVGNLKYFCPPGKLQKFNIEFESPYGVYRAGEAVVGAVCIQLSDSILM